MVKLDQILNVAVLDKLVEDGYIARKFHNEYPLAILNYTPTAQYDPDLVWGNEMNLSRGLVYTTDTNEVIARPFAKFWNINDTRHPETMEENLPNEIPLFLEKLDGSLGVMFRYANLNHVATRGSFHSEQAEWATKWLREKYPSLVLPTGSTVLSEVIYKENKIVIDYNFEGLVVLGMMDILTGREVPRWAVEKYCEFEKLPIVQEYQKSLAETLKEDVRNREGYVLTYPSTGVKVKVKFDEYVRLHKILTGLNIRSVWELLRDGQNETINGWLNDDRMPETFKTWVKNVWFSLTEKFEAIYNEVNLIYVNRPQLDQFMPYKESRKKMAEYFTQEQYRKYSGLLFGLLDGKKIDDMIWRMVEPSGNAVYRVDGE